MSEISSPHYSYCRELINHNLCVFKNGEGAQQVLPPLVGVVPEALTNLAVYYLKNDEVEEAYNLMKDTEPQTPSEYSIKGTVYAMYKVVLLISYFRGKTRSFGVIFGSKYVILGEFCANTCYFVFKLILKKRQIVFFCHFRIFVKPHCTVKEKTAKNW